MPPSPLIGWIYFRARTSGRVLACGSDAEVAVARGRLDVVGLPNL